MPKVYYSTVISAPLTRVWPVVRNFNGLPDWNPAIARSAIEAGLAADQVGCVRSFVTQDGGKYRERLLALSDEAYSFAYSILKSPLALQSYVACLEYRAIVENDTTFAAWSVHFECDELSIEDNTSIIRDRIMKPGFKALRQSLERTGLDH